MASTKSAATRDRETSQRVVKQDTIASLKAQVAELQKERDFFKANSLRKEGVIQMLQRKVDRLAQAGRAVPCTLSDRRAAMAEAKRTAMETGQTVAVSM